MRILPDLIHAIVIRDVKFVHAGQMKSPDMATIYALDSHDYGWNGALWFRDLKHVAQKWGPVF